MAKSDSKFVFNYEIGPQAAQDRAKQFMGGKIVRGIVELLTNSDAAYARLESDQQRKHRPISIRVDHAERCFEIKDRAEGMSPKTVKEKFTKGGATSAVGHRGYFGLGAKDCAVFGSLELHTIDKDGNYSTVEIPGDFRDCSGDYRKAIAEDYEKIHGESRQRSGTAIRINIDRRELGGASIPRFETLARDLRTHYALRSLIKRNKIHLTVVTSKKTNSEQLVYAGFPWENNRKATQVADTELKIQNYPDSIPRLVLYELEEPIDGDPKDETFEGFILVGSGDIADYGFTLAGLENQPHAKRLVGRLEDMHIQKLLDDYRNQGASEMNPSPVISQDRRHRNGGLEDSHPYASALKKALRPILQKALQNMQDKSKGAERAGISEALEVANRDAGRSLSDMFDAGGLGPEPKPLKEGFYFLPATKDIRRGSPGWTSISIYSIGGAAASEGEEVRLRLGNPEVCELESEVVTLIKMRNRTDGRRALVRLRAGSEPGTTELRASANGSSIEATVRVVDNPQPQTRFMFERSKYSVKPSKRRKVGVLVPENLIEEGTDNSVGIRLSDSQGGIVLRSSSERDALECAFDGEQIAYVVTFELEGRRIGARAELIATFRDLQAEAVITVGGGSVEVYIDDVTNPSLEQRSKVYEVALPCCKEEHINETCLHVFTRHPRIEPYLGEPTGDENIFWDLNDSPGFRAMCADSIAEAAAEFKIMSSMASQEEIPPQDLFNLFWKEKKNVLAKMQEIYIDKFKWDEQKKLVDFEEN